MAIPFSLNSLSTFSLDHTKALKNQFLKGFWIYHVMEMYLKNIPPYDLETWWQKVNCLLVVAL